MKPTTSILYILGTPYCGSTLLGYILGSCPGIFNAGEIQHFRRFPDIRSRICSCGRPVNACGIWGPLDFSRFRLFSKAKRSEQIRMMFRLLAGHLPIYPLPQGIDDAVFLHSLKGRLEQLGYEGFYILDNSKSPFRLLHLLTFEDLDLRILYLRRAIHGNVASFLKAKQSFLWGIFKYLLVNHLAEKLLTLCWRPSLTVCYERFCQEPEETLEQIARFLGIDFPSDMVRAVRNTVLHVFTGSNWRHHFNRDFQGVILDTSWKRRLKTRQIRLLDTLAHLMSWRKNPCA